MKTVRASVPLLLLLLSITAAASAQTPAQLSKGRRSIAFTLPDGGGTTIGLWKFTSDRTNVGLNLAVDYKRDTDSLSTFDRWSVAVGPAVKSYFRTSAHVAPYRLLGLHAGYSHDDSDVHSTT